MSQQDNRQSHNPAAHHLSAICKLMSQFKHTQLETLETIRETQQQWSHLLTGPQNMKADQRQATKPALRGLHGTFNAVGEFGIKKEKTTNR